MISSRKDRVVLTSEDSRRPLLFFSNLMKPKKYMNRKRINTKAIAIPAPRKPAPMGGSRSASRAPSAARVKSPQPLSMLLWHTVHQVAVSLMATSYNTALSNWTMMITHTRTYGEAIHERCKRYIARRLKPVKDFEIVVQRPILEIKSDNWSIARGPDFQSNSCCVVDCRCTMLWYMFSFQRTNDPPIPASSGFC